MITKKKKTKGTKKCIIEHRLKSEDYKYCLQASEIENDIKVLEDHNYGVDELKQNHKKFLNKYKIIKKPDSKAMGIIY